MYRNSFVLFSLFSVFQSSVSTTITVSRNTGSTDGDVVENRSCKLDDCRKSGLICVGNCCKCECPSEKPNYIVGKGLCKSNDEVKNELNADCKYTLRFKSGSPRLPDLPLTTQVSGQWNFSNHENELGVLCNHSIEAKTWENLNALAKWQKGVGSVFSISHYPVLIGGIDNDYQIEGLKWISKLHTQYAGTIIKISIRCETKELGCILAKVTGQKTYDPTKPEPPPTFPASTTTVTTTTVTTTTTTTTATTTVEPTTSTKVGNSQKVENNSPGALVPVLATVGAVLIIGVVISAIVLYKRRQGRNRDSENVKDPIYASVNKGFQRDIDNLRSHLGPLPVIPGTESQYQTLNQITRKDEDYDNTMNGSPPEADYDNPPIGFTKEKDSGSDYDNPPTQGPQGNSSDCDDPPTVEDEDSEKPDYDVPPTQAKDSVSSDQDGSDLEDTSF